MSGHGPEFFETRMGQQFYDGRVPQLVRALEHLAASAERIANVMEKPAVDPNLSAIAELMSGKQWNAATLLDVARVLRNAGFTIEDWPGVEP